MFAFVLCSAWFDPHHKKLYNWLCDKTKGLGLSFQEDIEDSDQTGQMSKLI